MTRVGSISVAACAALVFSGLVVPPAGAVPSGPPPNPPVQSVTSLGLVAQNPLVQGRDGTFTAAISGTSYWLFNDTSLTKNNAEGTNFISNSLSWTNNLNATQGITLNHDYLDNTGVPTEFMPFLPWEYQYNQAHNSNHCTAAPCGANLAIWPSAMVPDLVRKRALIFYTEVWRNPAQPGWTTLGTGIAVLSVTGTITRPMENAGSQYPTLMWPASVNGFGGGAVVVTNTMYMLGCVSGYLVQNCQLGRVALAQALDKAQWTYYAGNDSAGNPIWSSDESQAVTIFQGGAAGNSIFYNAYLGVYMAIYSGVFSNDVYFRVSYTPWGPWSNQTLIFTGESGWNGNADYAALAHTEFAQGNGQTQFITYVHTTGFLAQNLPLTKVVFGPEPAESRRSDAIP